jgi:hypothetical protein
MNKKCVTIIVCLGTILLVACAPSPQTIQTAISQTQGAWTPIPTQTAYPTQTSYPTQTRVIITQVYVWTPTNEDSSDDCKPIKTMDYTNNSKVAILLQAYVVGLPRVKSVSYVYPEKLYSNTLSELFHVSYTDSEDGKTYSKRYIVYMDEFGWKNAVFSIDGQCWIDPPH